MEKQLNSQLELFSETGNFADNRPKTERSFWSCIWGHEKKIFGLFGFILIGVIAFALGVEKGKRAAPLAQQAPISKKAITTGEFPKQVNAAQPQEPEKIVNVNPNPAIKVPQYTIQIASFKGRDLAQKEAELLKKKGFSPLLVNKKGVTVIYIGSFTNKETAKSLLSQLQKRYKDCFIRRL